MKLACFLRASVLAVALVAVFNGSTFAAGLSGPAFYIHGVLYRTVGTPTDFSHTGAPAFTYDIIYNFGGVQRNVATAAPGDRDFNGGRWEVHALQVINYAGALADNAVDTNNNDILDTAEEVRVGITAGYLADLGVVRRFECTVNRLPAREQP